MQTQMQMEGMRYRVVDHQDDTQAAIQDAQRLQHMASEAAEMRDMQEDMARMIDRHEEQVEEIADHGDSTLHHCTEANKEVKTWAKGRHAKFGLALVGLAAGAATGGVGALALGASLFGGASLVAAGAGGAVGAVVSGRVGKNARFRTGELANQTIDPSEAGPRAVAAPAAAEEEVEEEVEDEDVVRLREAERKVEMHQAADNYFARKALREAEAEVEALKRRIAAKAEQRITAGRRLEYLQQNADLSNPRVQAEVQQLKAIVDMHETLVDVRSAQAGNTDKLVAQGQSLARYSRCVTIADHNTKVASRMHQHGSHNALVAAMGGFSATAGLSRPDLCEGPAPAATAAGSRLRAGAAGAPQQHQPLAADAPHSEHVANGLTCVSSVLADLKADAMTQREVLKEDSKLIDQATEKTGTAVERVKKTTTRVEWS